VPRAAGFTLSSSLLLACAGDDPASGHSDGADTSDEGSGEGGGAWWQPHPRAHADWDWQITEPYDVSASRSMYDLDLFDLAVESSYLLAPSGETIAVEAGPLAGTIDELHARGTIVICYLDSGAYEAYRPDAVLFPGHHPVAADIPDGAPPEPGSVIGWNTGWEDERWLDIRADHREAFAEIIWARLDLAVRLGCDGVEPDQNNPLDNDPGFPITLDDQLSWYREVAEAAHARGLSVGMKNGHDQPGAVAALVDDFDWALPEECAEYQECDVLAGFVDAGKAVFAVDYMGSVDESAACKSHADRGLDGLIKDEPPSGAYRRGCSDGG
jgi:Glycoside-hydrolase family GH114